SLMRRRMLCLSAGDKPAEQLQVFDFPLHFNQTRRKLGLFTMALFRQSRFSETPLFRGFYFASCPMPQNRREDAAADDQDESRIISPGYFAEDFFREVLLRDKDLAASFQETQAQPNRHRRMMLAAAALAGLCLFLTLGMNVSFFNNRELIEYAKTQGGELLGQFKPDYARAGNQPGSGAGGRAGSRASNSAGTSAADKQNDLNSLNPMLDAIERIDRQRESWIGSLPYRFGLYSGDDLRPRLREIYFEFVSLRFLSPTLSGLSQRLDQATPSQTNSGDQGIDQEQLYYDMLKAYKMGERQAYVEPEFWREQLTRYWEEPLTYRQKRHLVYFTDQADLCDDDDGSVPRPQADDERVKAARGKLQNYSAEKLAYSQIIRDIKKRGGGEPYSLPDATKDYPGSEWIENPSSQSVPYAFTKQAFYKHVQGAALLNIYEELKEKNENDYVLDRKSEYAKVTVDKLWDRYKAGYVEAWKKFTGSLRVKPFDRKEKEDAVQALKVLSQHDSVFRAILNAVKEQTTLSEPPISDGFIGWLKSWTMKGSKGASDVEKEFSSLKTFDISGYLGKLEEVTKKLSSKNGDKWRDVANLKDDQDFK